MMARWLVILGLVITLAPTARAQGKADEALTKATLLVEKQVQDWQGKNFGAANIAEKYVREAFPDHVFVAVHFPQWPVAVATPDKMKSANLFAVSKEGKVLYLDDPKALEKFFQANANPKFSMDKTVFTWLRLRMEYVQDGYFKFKYPTTTEMIAGSSLTIVTGIVQVDPGMGNGGSLKASIRFDRDNRFAGVFEENKVVAGIRPRCQATLLLHPEKLVREIAEQDLLVMGKAARGYLMQQRARASAELCREIDRVWQRIEAEGR